MARRAQAGAVPARPGAPRIIGQSAPIKALVRLIQIVGPTKATVLIQGERGTGKNLVADALQQRSDRRGRPYVKLNCGALPPARLASEFFGHQRGAFAGAFQGKAGLLTIADRGTLFLDEIDALPLEAQAMLLRFLDWGEVRPLGSTETFRVDVRVIAATNTDLDEAIRAQEFTSDLYDRLREVVLDVPPLRERREDIPLLAEHFVALYSQKHGVRVRGMSPQTRHALQTHSWPGNVRELEKTLSRAVIYAAGGWIRLQHLAGSVSEVTPEGHPPGRTAPLLLVDLRTQEARYKGHPLALPPLAFQLLALLASRPGQLVTKDEIYARLWPESRHHAGEEHPYEQQIADHKRKLVRSLRDLTAQNRQLSPTELEHLVQTKPRRGYLLALSDRDVAMITPAQ